MNGRLFTFVVGTGIVYLVFLVGWVFRDRLGVPGSRLRGYWVVLIVVPVVLVAFLVGDALLPWWAKSLLAGAVGLLHPWYQARLKQEAARDPLFGREARVVTGHPSPLQIEVDGELWRASAEPGVVVLQGERVKILRRDGMDLVVGR